MNVTMNKVEMREEKMREEEKRRSLFLVIVKLHLHRGQFSR